MELPMFIYNTDIIEKKYNTDEGTYSEQTSIPASNYKCYPGCWQKHKSILCPPINKEEKNI
jgi:hypothetical protein